MNETLVFGATGNVGGHVVRELRERRVPVRAFVREPERAGALRGAGVELRRGDLDDPGSVRAAVEGVTRVLLCSPNDPRQMERETARPGSPSAFAAAHASTRPTCWPAAETIRAMGRFFLPAGDAKVAMTDPRDVAAVAAAVLTEDGHDGRTYLITGPVALTCAEAAAELSAALGRPVEFVDVPDEAAHAAMVAAGLPEWLAGQIVLLWGELRRGAGSTTTDVVRVLTGHEPRSVADFARDHATAFGAPASVTP